MNLAESSQAQLRSGAQEWGQIFLLEINEILVLFLMQHFPVAILTNRLCPTHFSSHHKLEKNIFNLVLCYYFCFLRVFSQNLASKTILEYIVRKKK